MRRAWIALLAAFFGCDDGPTEETPMPDAGPASEAQTLVHDFPPFAVEPGEELWRYCQSWTLGNEVPLYVNRVTATNQGGWHHSNWLYVRETSFRGSDGTWTCRDRGYDEVAAGLNGGVFFAQSTQALVETQRFPPGVAVRLPPRTRILGGVHLLNASPERMDTAMRFEVETIAEEDVHTELQPLSFTYNDLEIAPRAESRFTMDCDIAEAYEEQVGRAPDFRIYYVLPHYHALGNYFRLQIVGGERDGEVIFETHSTIGDALGLTLDPPIEVSGATAIRMTCGYDNPRDAWVGYGIGDQEMCVVLAFTDSPLRLLGYGEANELVGTEGDIQLNRGTCNSYGVIEF